MWISDRKSGSSIIIMLIDVLIINISIILAYLLRFNFTLPSYNFDPYLQLFLWISLGSLFFLNMYQMYSIAPRSRWDNQFYSIVLVVLLTLMLSISLTYISANYAFPRSVFLLSGLIQLILLSLWRYFLWRAAKKALGVQKAIIIGTGQETWEIAERFTEFPESHIEIIGVITEEDSLTEANSRKFPVMGSLDDFDKILKNNTVCNVVVITPSLDAVLKEQIVGYCYSSGKEVFLIPALYEVLLVKAELNLIDDMPVFGIKDSNGESNFIKRVLDLIVAAVVFIITLPIMILIGLIIKIDSPGPIIYKQERVTKGGKLFTLYKFRTMVQNAEEDTGPVFAAEDDQRATSIGRILRLSRLDELPQLVNVIRGDMSMVGPRPERPFFVEQYVKEIYGYENRHRIKPGITGIAQIAGKYNTEPREKLVFDLLYAKRNNFWVDLQILLQTVKVLFIRDKAS
ncbi:sugar transferase [Phosphitispora sp. TUW77]|uniref:sugar transferase n=1 Tax=Phosphitispora sp. TUW77 TaxID=3152361 RepID=UPI003AB52291